MKPISFKDRVRDLIRVAQERSGISSYDELGRHLGVRGQSIANAVGKTRSSTMLSKPLLDELVAMAELSQDQKDDFDVAWLEWKLERSNDGGVGEFLLGIVRSKLRNKKELRAVLKKAAELRHRADRSAKD